MRILENGTATNTVSERSISLLKWLAPVLAVTFLTSLAAQLYIPLPFTPVPLTMQLFLVLLGGALLGRTRGGVSQGFYLLWGISGAPFFAGSAAGLAILSGPTGGYLVGFIPAAVIAGWLVPRAARRWQRWFVFFAASLVVLLCGTLQLYLVTGASIVHSAGLGLLPFLPGDLLKVTMAWGIYEGWISYRKPVR